MLVNQPPRLGLNPPGRFLLAATIFCAIGGAQYSAPSRNNSAQLAALRAQVTTLQAQLSDLQARGGCPLPADWQPHLRTIQSLISQASAASSAGTGPKFNPAISGTVQISIQTIPSNGDNGFVFVEFWDTAILAAHRSERWEFPSTPIPAQ